MKQSPLAYFSMEMSLEEGVPTYSGGLGVPVGDVMRSTAGLRIPVAQVDAAR
jgi:starch phosphorylase